ncbi:uncharacterized protein PV06_02439 [Exophiala oligosperma]|uniref:Uncharacterized protein n=1 Tax=Exophiala oligosperma TaxID=215243 RepID=A0A0D2DUH6_9EURO|nr:uncharacterized protein PV06_02439 [Exophiala oligosperma]KIW46803.1 hypothetical protein PV06_02439 [Exophiala oligosperma]
MLLITDESTEPIHEGVDEFVYDPIRTSLFAIIDDEQTAYNDLEKQDRHSLFKAATLDIWESNSQGVRILDRTYPVSRRLPEDLFDAYHPEVPQGGRLALRLLCTRPALKFSQVPRRHKLLHAEDRQIAHLPFIPSEMQDLIHQWDLNREYTWLRLMCREVGNFQRKTVWDDSISPSRAVRIGIVVNFPFVLRPARQVQLQVEAKPKQPRSPILVDRYRLQLREREEPRREDPFLWSFAMSHSLDNGQTRALLDGTTDAAVGDLKRRLLKAGSRWYLHPLHVPTVLLHIYFDHAAWEVNRLCKAVAHFEYLSRDAGIGSLEQFDTITTQLQYIRRSLDFQQSLAKFLLETMTFLDDKMLTTGAAGTTTASYRTYVHRANPHMEEKLANILHLIENDISTSQYLQSRTRDALDFIKGKIALRDNEANKEDADSNKTMQFLQMTFLPATFVAAIVSTNFFDLTASPPTVSSYFWIFWLVSVSLTALTLGAYFLWKWRAKQEAKRQEQEAEARKNEVERRDEGGTLGREGEGFDTDMTDSDGGGDWLGHRRRRRRRRRTTRKSSSVAAMDPENGQNGGKKKEKPEMVQ